MCRRIPLALACACVLLAFPPPARAAGEEDDLVGWVARSCPTQPDLDRFLRMDQVAGKAIMDGLRVGKFRQSVRLTLAWLGCFRQMGLAPQDEPFADRVAALRQIACFVPLVVFETERKVDTSLAGQVLGECPPPDTTAPARGSARRKWAEEVRRYVHLVGAAREPREVLGTAERYLAALAAAGMIGPDGSVAWGDEGEGGVRPGPAVPEGKAQQEGKAGGPAAQADETPDPVFAARVLGLAAAAASGDLERLVAAAGGAEAGCRSPFLAALGFLQALHPPREAALPMVLRTVIGRAPLDTYVALTRQATEKLGAECTVPALVASLGLSSLTPEAVDGVVLAGRSGELATLVAAAPSLVQVPGSPRARAAVLEAAAGRMSGQAKGQRLCELGDARMEERRPADALKAYVAAAAVLDPDEGACAAEGRLRAVLAGESPAADAVAEASRAFLATKPDGPSVLAALKSVRGGERRAEAIRALWAASEGGPSETRESVAEALLKAVDEEPGSPQASAAAGLLEGAGWPKDRDDRVLWKMILGRHLLLGRQPGDARRAFTEAFAGLKPRQEAASLGAEALLRWLASRRHYEMLDEVVRLARGARVARPRVLAELAGMVGEVGERGRARDLLAAALAMKPSKGEDWLAIANGYARIDDPVRASTYLLRVGPQKEWGPDVWMTKGRIETARKRYRDAVAAYGKAAEGGRDDCDPRFFRGLARLLLGDPDEAEADFRYCVENGEANPQVLGALAYSLFDQARYENAVDMFQQALAKDDQSADNHLGLALARFRIGKTGEALESFRRAQALEPVLAQGHRAAARKGFVYSDIEKKAWDDLAAEAARPARKK